MNTLSKLSFLALALTLGACNEKVSPELQGAASSTTTTGGTVIVPPSEYFFKVTNSSDSMLNYKLHKTGAGNANVDCEVSSSIALSSDLFRTDPTTYDITCYMEAEELALSLNGLSFKVEASANTCANIGYSPFSYYNYQPGNSTQSMQKLNCVNGATAAFARTANGTIAAGITCDSYLSSEAGAVNAAATADNAFCNFDYSTIPGFPSDAPNCDDGVLSIAEYTAVGVDTDVDGDIDAATVTRTTRLVECGGKAVNCIEGPIKLTSLTKFTSGVEMTKASANTAYSKTYDLPALYGTYPTNRRYVNFRRDLASTEIEYGDSDRELNDGDESTNSTLSSAYQSSWGDPFNKTNFESDVMLLYSNNKKMDGTTLVTPAMIAANKFDFMRGQIAGGNYSKGVPYAGDPFVGLGKNYATSPFYTFYCFDGAYDTRARIKMVVRDWDRSLPASATSASFESISDVDQLPPFARQDVPYTEEITGDPDSWNDFNDIFDWDDLIDMERDDSGFPYDPSITVYRPLPAGNFTQGFMNPYIFPMESKAD